MNSLMEKMRAELEAGHAGGQGRMLGRGAQATVPGASVAAHWLEKSSCGRGDTITGKTEAKAALGWDGKSRLC